MLTLSLLGFLLGVRHATDPDHIVAVSTIVSGQRSMLRGALVGAQWGLGHTLTLLVAGGAMIVFRFAVPPRVGLALEFLVAVMLVGLGTSNLLAARGPAIADGTTPVPSRWRPLAIGVVHGLAGSAAVALLVLATIPDTVWAVVYLGVFGAGTIAGMVMMTIAISAPTIVLGARMPTLRGRMQFAAGALSVGVGLLLMHRTGIADGLFSDAPRWTPH